MKIGFISPHYLPFRGGIETLVQAIAESIARSDHHVEVLTLDTTGKLPAQQEVNRVLIRRFREWVPGDVYHVGLSLFYYLLAHREEYDIVNAHNYHALPLLWASVTHGNRLVASTHYHGQGHSAHANLLHPFYRPFGRWALRRARKVICASQFEQELVCAHLQVAIEKTEIIPDGIHLAALRAAQALDVHAPVLLYVGRLEKYKRVDLAIASLPNLPEDYRLFIIGKGQEEDDLRLQARQMKVDHRVVFMKDVSNDLLYQWYRSAQLLVMLSEAESFPMTCIEALAAGCRVVCPDRSPFTELAIEFPKAIFPIQDPSPIALADQIKGIAGLTGRADVDLSKYDWDNIASETLRIFEEIASP
jgi:glycosyltransferase involved in cell wall biosynthesis